MAFEFETDNYFGYSGVINRNGTNNTFNVDNDNSSTINFMADGPSGDLFLDSAFSTTPDPDTLVSIDDGTFVEFTVVEFGTFYPEGGSGPYQYVIIDVDGQQHMFLHEDGSSFLPTSNPFVTGNHNPLDDNPVCFVRGTLILTENGSVLVENLSVGDTIQTRNSGCQVISWMSQKTMSTNTNARHTPIRISANALGDGLPKRDLLVSPQHRILLTDWRAELLFGEPEVLVPAKHLVNDDTIRVATDLEEFEYFHILFDSHQTIFSEGLPTESFHPGDTAMNSLSEASRNEVLELFPELADGAANYGPAAHPSLKSFEAKALQRA